MNVHAKKILQANQWECLLFSEIYVATKWTAIINRRNENKKII